MEKVLILTVGLPRSGKSTWAKQQGLPIVNLDAIRLALHGQAFVPDAEDMVWTMGRYMVKSLFLAGHDKVIVDATNGTRARRDKWVGDWMRAFVKFDTDMETCLSRASDELKPVIRRMAGIWEDVSPDEINA